MARVLKPPAPVELAAVLWGWANNFGANDPV
jgi:hypothetical protein